MNGTTAASPLSEYFDILSNEYRRRILWALTNPQPRVNGESKRGVNGELELSQLTEERDEPDILQLKLVHTHFPKLNNHQFVDWDGETGTLTRGPRFSEIEPLLRLMNTHQDELPNGWP